MTNNKLQIKIKERLNKLDSKDYDNLECWQISEAFNKAQIEWVRRQLHGGNLYKEGTEQSIKRIDDLQILLTTYTLNGNNVDLFFESSNLPKNYLQFNKVSIKGIKDKCKASNFKIFLAEESDVEILLSDENYKPSFNWRETFNTIIDNKIRIYTNSDFKIQEATLTYFRNPKEIRILDCINLDTGSEYNTEQTCEFKDDIVEVIIDMAASILAGDIESIQTQRLQTNSEQNN